jgi:hypothetical protein
MKRGEEKNSCYCLESDPPEGWVELLALILGLLPTIFSASVAIYNELKKMGWVK